MAEVSAYELAVDQRESAGAAEDDRAVEAVLEVLLTLRPHLAQVLRSLLLDSGPIAGSDLLSAREIEVARLVAGGWSNRELAVQLGVREDTVKKHLWRVMSKLGLHNRTQVALLFSRGLGDSTFVQ